MKTMFMEECTEVKNQLKGSAMKASTPLILATALLVAVIQPAFAGEAAKVGATALSAESTERLKRIGAGYYGITPAREDVSLVLRALQDRDLTVSSHACLAVEKMAPQKLFKPEDMKALWEGLRPNLRSQHDDSSEWSARGVKSLCWYTELLDGAFLDEAFDETLLMVSSNSPEMRWRGVGLSRYLVKRLPKDKCEKLVRALLAVNAEARWNNMVTAALGSAAPKIESQALANEVAARLLAATKNRPAPDVGFDGGVREWQGLAYLAGTTSRETREQIVGAILAATADGRCAYSSTSGMPSPPKHAGAEALAILASFLTLEEVERAEKAIPPQAAGEKKEWYNSMYAAAKEALAARKLVAEHQAQPASRVEEDVAFFEKKYGRKITGVKPKSEYDDPDKFYSLIGEQLGIPEIAWKAAAEKYGWKQDDGKNTFTMLKGGPVFGALQGSWEVLIMRSKPNPETMKPDLKTMEQVMVQVDYDGNVKFPEHGIEHKRLRIPTEPGHSMEETAKILIHDIQFGDRAKDKAIQHGDDIIPLIRKETKDFTVLVRADWIADVLGAIKTESSRKVLLDLYSRTNDLTRLVGAVGLARQGALTGPVDENSFLVRTARDAVRSPHTEMAIRALGLSRDEKVLPLLVDLLQKGRGARLDGVTCEALAAIGSKDAIPVLRDCLKSDKFYALPSAFRALIILGDRDAIPLAIARLTPEDKRSGGARWIVVDLRLMTGEKFGFDQASWLQWWDSAKGSWQIPEKFRKPWDYKDYMGMEAK